MIQIGLNATAGFSDALRWYMYAKAAARGHIGGMFELAVAFEYNRGLVGIAQPAQLASAKWRTQQAASL
jgi:TPR repeat protein